MIMVIWKWLW